MDIEVARKIGILNSDILENDLLTPTFDTLMRTYK
jgi:hypothetical protein